jgi:hypothetical protein
MLDINNPSGHQSSDATDDITYIADKFIVCGLWTNRFYQEPLQNPWVENVEVCN